MYHPHPLCRAEHQALNRLKVYKFISTTVHATSNLFAPICLAQDCEAANIKYSVFFPCSKMAKFAQTPLVLHFGFWFSVFGSLFWFLVLCFWFLDLRFGFWFSILVFGSLFWFSILVFGSPFWFLLNVSSNFCHFCNVLKQFISVDSPSWAEQNSANDFVVACMSVEIFCVLFGR